MHNNIDHLLEIYPDLDDLFDQLEITPYDVIKILLKGGHIVMPEYLIEDRDDDDRLDSER